MTALKPLPSTSLNAFSDLHLLLIRQLTRHAPFRQPVYSQVFRIRAGMIPSVAVIQGVAER